MIERLAFVFLACMGINAVKTLRKINEIAGHRKAATMLIAVDTIIFLLVFRDLITNELTVPVVAVMAIGYVTGYNIGSWVEEKMALGEVSVTIKIPKSQSKELWRRLKESGFVFTRTQRAYSHKDKPRKFYHGIIFRKELPKLKKILDGLNYVSHAEPVKDIFGKRLVKSDEYLEKEKKKQSTEE